MNHTILTYSIYLPVTIMVTVWVATTLFKNGRLFLLDVFKGDEDLTDNVNRLLLVGFYLINIGYAVITLTITGTVEDMREMIEVLSTKLGKIILILGFMHFFNMFVFFRIKKKAKYNTVEH